MTGLLRTGCAKQGTQGCVGARNVGKLAEIAVKYSDADLGQFVKISQQRIELIKIEHRPHAFSTPLKNCDIAQSMRTNSKKNEQIQL